MRKITMIAAIAALSLALLSSCEKKSESITSSSELVSQNFIDSYILLSANEEISDSELDEAAKIFGRRTDALRFHIEHMLIMTPIQSVSTSNMMTAPLINCLKQ